MPENAPGHQPLVSSRMLADYEAIEATLLASLRGRWFLSEYMRRNRNADTQVLLDAIAKLEKAIVEPQRPADTRMLSELVEMSEAIARTRREIAAIRPPDQVESQIITATEELDAVVEATEKATSDILQAAEQIQEAAWNMREKGADDALCDLLDAQATDIYTAYSFQDLTGQRTARVVRLLRFIEQRINAMIEIWGVGEADLKHQPANEPERDDAHLLNGPQREGDGLAQDDIDRMLTGAEAVQFDEVVAVDAVEPGEEPKEAVAAGASVEDMIAAAFPDAKPAEAMTEAVESFEAVEAIEAVQSEPDPAMSAASQAETDGLSQNGLNQSEIPRGKYFAHPEPLTLDRLHAVTRAALFG